MQTPSEKVREFIVSNFLFGDDTDLRDDTSFLESEIIDSTGILELVSFLEQEFSVAIADEELIPENLDSLHSISAYLQRKTLEVPPPALERVPGSGASAPI